MPESAYGQEETLKSMIPRSGISDLSIGFREYGGIRRVKLEKAGAAGTNPGSALVLYRPDEACLVQTGPFRAI